MSCSPHTFDQKAALCRAAANTVYFATCNASVGCSVLATTSRAPTTITCCPSDSRWSASCEVAAYSALCRRLHSSIDWRSGDPRRRSAGRARRACALQVHRSALRITTRDGIDELLQRGPHLRMHLFERPRSGTAAHVDDVVRLGAGSTFIATLSYSADRETCGSSDGSHTTEPAGFGTCPQATLPFIQRGIQQAPLLANQLLGIVRRPHSRRRSRVTTCCRSPRPISIAIRSTRSFEGP